MWFIFPIFYGGILPLFFLLLRIAVPIVLLCLIYRVFKGIFRR